MALHLPSMCKGLLVFHSIPNTTESKVKTNNHQSYSLITESSFKLLFDFNYKIVTKTTLYYTLWINHKMTNTYKQLPSPIETLDLLQPHSAFPSLLKEYYWHLHLPDAYSQHVLKVITNFQAPSTPSLLNYRPEGLGLHFGNVIHQTMTPPHTLTACASLLSRSTKIASALPRGCSHSLSQHPVQQQHRIQTVRSTFPAYLQLQ